MTAAELLIAKEALAEARADGYNTEKALAWLTAAHAEERAMRASLKEQLANKQVCLRKPEGLFLMRRKFEDLRARAEQTRPMLVSLRVWLANNDVRSEEAGGLGSGR